MRKLYIEIIDECIDQFRLEEGRTFNFSLLDFSDEVFHNYGLKPHLTSREIALLLTHTQKIVSTFPRGHDNPAVKRLTEFLLKELRLFTPSDQNVLTIFEIIFQGKPASVIPSLTSKHIARFISLLPLKHYWDNSGVIYQRAYEREESFRNAYLCQYWYKNRQPQAEIRCREIEILQQKADPFALQQKLQELQHLPFRTNAEYFGLNRNDEELYELYGQLFDLLNWGASNPEGIINYLDSRTQEFSFYNCVFPLVLHGIYYGIAYFDLPTNFFEDANLAAQKLNWILYKGWTYVNHYFPAIIIDAYNSRLINRFTQGDFNAVDDIVKAVNGKVPFRFCYDRQNGVLYYFKFVPGEIGKHLEKFTCAKALDCHSSTFRERLLALDSAIHPGQLQAIPQKILDQDLIFLFDIYFLPGKEKCLPILESHLGQAAFVLETMQDQRQREVYEERNRILDMFAHDAKTTQELLIADLEEGMDSDLAALQLREQSRKERVLRNHLLGRRSVLGNEPADSPEKQAALQNLFAELFFKTWRSWLRSRRFRESFRRNRHPALRLSPDSSKSEIERFFAAYSQQYPGQPGKACLEILRASFCDLSPSAAIQVVAPPLLLLEHAVIRVEEILYNLLSNFFKHAAPSPLTGYNECAMEIKATPSPQGIYFRFSFSNSTSTKERFEEDLKKLCQYGHEIHGLQIIRYLLEADAGETPPELEMWQEDYVWHIEIGRVCHGCRQNPLVDPGA